MNCVFHFLYLPITTEVMGIWHPDSYRDAKHVSANNEHDVC